MKIDFANRIVLGKKVADLRESGETPVVCYGGKEQSKSYSINTKMLKKMISSDEVVITTGGDLQGKQVILQDLAVHPVSGMPMHADFLFVDAKHEVEHEVPIRIEGESPAVKTHGGQIVIALDKVYVRALLQNIPGHLTISVSSLEEIGSHIVASDIELPNNVDLVTNPTEIVISIVEQAPEEEEETAEELDIENIEVTGKGGKKETEEVDPEE